MRVKLKPQKLEKKKGKTAHKGVAQSIVYVLVIAMLLDEEMYKASTAAATAFDPTEENEYYLTIMHLLRNWANSPGKNITLTPDNGPREKRTGILSAMWLGKTWKKNVGAAIWNLVVRIFDRVCKMDEEDRRKGLAGVTYWWDSKANEIIRKYPEEPAIEQVPPSVCKALAIIEKPGIVALEGSVIEVGRETTREPYAGTLRIGRNPKPKPRVWGTFAAIAAVIIIVVFLRPNRELKEFQELDRPKETEWSRRGESIRFKGKKTDWPVVAVEIFNSPIKNNEGVSAESLVEAGRHPIIDQARMVILLDH